MLLIQGIGSELDTDLILQEVQLNEHDDSDDDDDNETLLELISGVINVEVGETVEVSLESGRNIIGRVVATSYEDSSLLFRGMEGRGGLYRWCCKCNYSDKCNECLKPACIKEEWVKMDNVTRRVTLIGTPDGFEVQMGE